jgi:sulfide dehydrogenase [flavocytochrome c] flavoprotein subunit
MNIRIAIGAEDPLGEPADQTRRSLAGAFLFVASGALFAKVSTVAASSHTKARVVVVGGGFGGATAAKYLKISDPGIDVTLVESRSTFQTCPFGNLYLAGELPLENLQHGYAGLSSKFGVRVVHEQAVDIDGDRSEVKLASGRVLAYDRLILAPGVSIRWGALNGYDEAASRSMPHAWLGDGQLRLLKSRLEAIDDGDTFVMVAPALPYRCPPGPYERASLIAHYFARHKPRSKILILDAKDGFSKRPLFASAWQSLYGDRISWVSLADGGKVARVDPKANEVELENGDRVKAGLVNVIPPQRAASICERAGVVDASGWVPIRPRTFESRLRDGIHVIGDSAIADPMPKSGFCANTQAKVCAVAIASLVNGHEPPDPVWTNTCYSLVAPDYGISVAGVYRTRDDKIGEVTGAGGFSPVDAPEHVRRKEAEHARTWYRAITRDIWPA